MIRQRDRIELIIIEATVIKDIHRITDTIVVRLCYEPRSFLVSCFLRASSKRSNFQANLRHLTATSYSKKISPAIRNGLALINRVVTLAVENRSDGNNFQTEQSVVNR